MGSVVLGSHRGSEPATHPAGSLHLGKVCKKTNTITQQEHKQNSHTQCTTHFAAVLGLEPRTWYMPEESSRTELGLQIMVILHICLFLRWVSVYIPGCP